MSHSRNEAAAAAAAAEEEENETIKLHKAMVRNPSFKQQYRNQLYDVNLCRFDTKQREGEEERKAKQAEDKIR